MLVAFVVFLYLLHDSVWERWQLALVLVNGKLPLALP